MKIKLSSIDILHMAKALKSGWLDTDKVERFKSLVEGYNPPKEIDSRELEYYLDCLYKGWGYSPAIQKEIQGMIKKGLDADLLDKWQHQIDDNSIYKMLVREAFLGMVAVKALGGMFTDEDSDFSFIDREIPEFG